VSAAPSGRLAGRVALVTGGGRGFGRAIVDTFAAEGADVAVNYNATARGAAEAAAAAEKLGRRALAVHADVAREDQVRTMIEQVLQRFGRIDVLVNNAGIMTRGPFLDVPQKDYESMWGINVTGTFLCTQYALKPMVAAKYGRIINLSSQLARMSVGGGFAAYAATKGAVEAFTRAMAHEFGQHGVTVNAIAPGGIDTDMSKAVMTPEYRERRIKELPVRHLGEVADVAYCAVFLAAQESNYLTGQVLQPNGGWVMA
jgi:3-oxoacyl-[acyl-carrier protein] reductase